ncbi:uncharacterized protein LOC143301859 [Babylonia areolata]|uniref:uncharacterized protein LOC143301859 n=1 Tax=Babylonia areolata TaxID=304850 RepID=UPI003FD5D449
MAVKTSTVGAMTLYFSVVAGYYCDSDKCSDDEYCCGYNLCCKSYKVWDMWYFWCGLLFFLFLLSMCTCIWRLRSRSSLIIGRYTYTRLQRDSTFIHSCPAASSAMMSHGPPSFSDPSGHPPPYVQPDNSHSKSPSPPPAYAQVVAQR